MKIIRLMLILGIGLQLGSVYKQSREQICVKNTNTIIVEQFLG